MLVHTRLYLYITQVVIYKYVIHLELGGAGYEAILITAKYIHIFLFDFLL